jgi:DNA-directed RNA polymerase specialized sigma24 family protein
MESLRALAYLTCGDWQLAEDAVVTALSKIYPKWRRIDRPAFYARRAVMTAAIDEVRRPWWRREQMAGDALPETGTPAPQAAAPDGLVVRRGGGGRGGCPRGAAVDHPPGDRARGEAP